MIFVRGCAHMMKLCKSCHDQHNGYAINPLYPMCIYGYSYILSSSAMNNLHCPHAECKFHAENKHCDLVDIDITPEDFKAIMCVSNDCDFIDAMISLKQTDPIEYGMKMAQIRPAAEQAQQAIDAAWNKKVEEANAPIPKCPKCGSKSIATTNRGFSIITGFIGSGSPRNVCQSCGYKWKP